MRTPSRMILAACATLLMAAGCTTVSPRPKNTLRTLLHLSPSASRVGAPDFTRRMDAVTSSRLLGGNHVRLLVNGEQAFPAMLEAIAHARVRISLASYILRVDTVGRRFLAALAAAARRKVEVRLLLDAFGSKGLQRRNLDDLGRAGGQVRLFNPLRRWTLLRVNNRNHRKILVVDGSIAFIGGLNLARDYDGNGRSGWRDTHLRMQGPAAYELEQVFAASWQQGGSGLLGKDLPVVGVNSLKHALEQPLLIVLGRRAWHPPAPVPAARTPFATSPGAGEQAGGASVRIVWSDPDRVASRILDMYLLAINSAHTRVWISSGYFVPPSILMRALVAAARRRVDVRLLLQGVTDEPTVRTLSVGFYGKLLKNGVRLHEWSGTILHAKTMVVDGLWCTVGSCNLDGRALFLDYEANAAVLDQRLAAAMEKQFLRDLEQATPVSLTDWQNRPLQQKAVEKLLTPVKGQF